MTNARVQYYLTVANEITPSSRNPYALCKELEIEVINNCELHKDAYFVCQGGLKLIFVNSCIKIGTEENLSQHMKLDIIFYTRIIYIAAITFLK